MLPTDELQECRMTTQAAENKRTDMEAEMQKMQHELEEAKSAITILELSKQDEIESVSRQCAEELASLQSIMKGTCNVTYCSLTVKDIA